MGQFATASNQWPWWVSKEVDRMLGDWWRTSMIMNSLLSNDLYISNSYTVWPAAPGLLVPNTIRWCWAHTHFSWSAVRARHALVAEVGLSAVRPVTVCVEVVRARPWREFQNVHALSLNSCAQFAHSLRTVNEVTRKCYYKCRRDKWWHLGNFFWTFQISRHDIARTISPDPHSHAHCHEFFPHCHEPFIAPVSGLFM